MQAGEEDDHEQLLAALTEAAEEDPNAAFQIGEADLGASADLLGETGDPVPSGEFPSELPVGEGFSIPEELYAPPPAESEGHDSLEDSLDALTTEALDSILTPPEGIDPLDDVDSLLADEVLADFPSPTPDLFVPTGEQPTFQLLLEIPEASLKPKLKELAASQGLTLTDSAWDRAVPVLSQLTEFQAVLFQRAARALGVVVRPSVHFPAASPTEEDLALGDLAAIVDPVGTQSEGAPSVELPGREKEVLLVSADLLPGFHVIETRGPITAHRAIARRFFQETEAQEKLNKELARLPGRGAVMADSRVQLLFREVFLDLQKQALAMGGNAVLGLRVESFPERESLDPSAEQLRLLVIGTAAVVEKSL